VRLVRIGVGLVSLLLAVGSISAGVAGAQSAKDPLELFAPLYPVFSDDRCANCHGGVNVVTGEDHPGGPVNVKLQNDGSMCCDNKVGIVCATCHDEGAETDPETGAVTGTPWKLPQQRHSFVGKDLKAMCVSVRDNNGLNQGDKAQWNAFFSHLESDELIGFAFEGKRGITDKSPEGPVSAEPPPMSREEFLQKVDAWLRQGDARCGPWKGTISQTTTRNVIAGGNEDVLDAQVDITVEDGDAKAHVTANGHTYSKGQACEYRRDTFNLTGDTTIDLQLLFNSDMTGGFLPPGVSIPNVPNMPNIPGFGPAGGAGNASAADFESNTGYSMIIKSGTLKGTDAWEESTASGDPPKCTVKSGSSDWQYQPTFGLFQKQLDPNDPDHLKDSDSSSQGPDEIRVAWDLTR